MKHDALCSCPQPVACPSWATPLLQTNTVTVKNAAPYLISARQTPEQRDSSATHQNFYMALRALIALAELAPALSALSAPAAHSNLLAREYHGENMPCGKQIA